MIEDLNFDAVCAFAVFADHLNFTHAAEQLHISQPALFVKIQELAKSTGTQLYTKTGRQLKLTENGTLLARFGRELIERRQSIVSELNGQKDSQPVVLAAGEGAFLYLLGQAISNYKSKSNQPLRLLTLNRDSVVEAIQSGKAHFGVAAFDTIPASCQSRPLNKADQLLVMPKDCNLAGKKKTVSLADLQGLSLVVPAIDRPHRQLIATHLQSAGVEWQVAVEANGWELMLHFVKLGLGCAIVNSICNIPSGLTAKKIVDLPQIHYSIIWRRSAKLSASQTLLRDCLSP